MINFNSKCWEDTYSPEKAAQARSEHSKCILNDLANTKQDKFFLGVHLIEFYNSNSYSNQIERKTKFNYYLLKSTDTNEYWGNVRSSVFFDYCFDQFGLDKTQVSRLMNVVDEFGDEFIGFAKEWQAYSYSQLVEMLPFTAEQRKSIQPDWTIKRIREYKKDLVATSQQNKPSDSKPSVATSQQQSEPCNFFHKIIIPPSDLYSYYAKYDRFRGKSAQYLCDKVIELEKLNSELIAQLDKLNNASLDEATDDSFKGIPMLGRSSLLEQSVLSRTGGAE